MRTPLNERYALRTDFLDAYFSDYAITKKKIYVEVEYYIHLLYTVSNPPTLAESTNLRNIYKHFSMIDHMKILEVEKLINHDLKAIEYFLRTKIDRHNYIHFGLTSQDINNTAIPLVLKEWFKNEYLPTIQRLINAMESICEYEKIPMLARTHGQVAVPTYLDKEIYVFVYRLQEQLKVLKNIPFTGKFGGAVGNLSAHKLAYPDVNWEKFADNFLDYIGLKRQQYTTQVENYDNLAAFFDGLRRVNTILLDFSKDIWQYISMDYLSLKSIGYEVGSSTMPHKVNPIDFENAEGNLGYANSIFSFFSEKLPISRMQRDLSDSTVLRNIGVPIAHTHIAIQSLIQGINKLAVNKEVINKDLDSNWQILTEALQILLRKEGFSNPYEDIKKESMGRTLSKKDLHKIINNLKIEEELREKLLALTPQNYI
jgi:adenylosuccinate lyase